VDPRSTSSTDVDFFRRKPDFQLRDFGASSPDTFFSQKVFSSLARQPVMVAGTAAAAGSAGAGDDAGSGSLSVVRNDAGISLACGSGDEAGGAANSYAAGAGSTCFGAGSDAVDAGLDDRGETESFAGAGARLLGAGSNESTRSSRCRLPLASTSASQLTMDDDRDMSKAAAATTQSVPTTTVRGARADWRFATRERLVPDAEGFDVLVRAR